MQKLYASPSDAPHEETEHCASCEAYYLASEVDARIANIIATDSTRIAQLEYRIAELEKALRFYADPKQWREFRVTEGDIFGSREDDLAFAFNAEDDSPWNVAANVL